MTTHFGVGLEQQEGFEFRVRPNATRRVRAAVANCLAASLERTAQGREFGDLLHVVHATGKVAYAVA